LKKVLEPVAVEAPPSPPNPAPCSLCSATVALTRGLEEQTLLEQILGEGMTLVEAEAASLVLVEADGASLFFKAAVGPDNQEIVHRIVPLNESSVARQVLLQGEPMIVGDAQQAPEHNKETDRILHFSTRNLVAVPVLWNGSALGVVEAVNRKVGTFGPRDVEILQVTAAQLASALQTISAPRRLRELLMESIELVVQLMQAYGTVSRDHLVNVAQLATAVGRECGLEETVLEKLTYAGMLHDLGLAGPPLDDPQKHAHRGAELLHCIPMLEPILPAVQYHHERWDGSGPFALQREQIPLEARILALAEEWCECKPWDNPEQVDEFREHFFTRFGTDFDPALAESFRRALGTTLQRSSAGGSAP
jgi:HD-GYP domain-containing protein (c-di-GMP phosphodiesterase class II)